MDPSSPSINDGERASSVSLKRKILLDVDIGSSVDSILSLFLLLASSGKDVEIVGITTSYNPLGPDQVDCAGI